ncbi:hypothetical protein A4X13_0g7674 [Tilletia indica]|uniref:Uncharacterized protein n=1 Tax=Tilletia indica TaxID=43049 RepID=A0A177TIN9_9BASI|nr:hypothetical protein A4X13_0g7674 [Tilletia indica]
MSRLSAPAPLDPLTVRGMQQTAAVGIINAVEKSSPRPLPTPITQSSGNRPSSGSSRSSSVSFSLAGPGSSLDHVLARQPCRLQGWYCRGMRLEVNNG